MPVKMKKEIRKRIACMMGTTQKAIREAEAECDGRAFMYHAKGTLSGFYLLHVPAKGKIAPTLFPTDLNFPAFHPLKSLQNLTLR